MAPPTYHLPLALSIQDLYDMVYGLQDVEYVGYGTAVPLWLSYSFPEQQAASSLTISVNIHTTTTAFKGSMWHICSAM